MLPGKDNFRFFIPIDEFTKAKDGKGQVIMKMAGFASTKRRDTDDEILNPAGFDISYLKERGIVNWNHDKDPSSIIGEPSLAEIRKGGLFVESTLYPKSKKAKRVYELAETLKESGAKRRLGYSIEGKAIERDPTDPSHVTKAMITNVAITISPKNPDSIIDIVKGDYQGWADDEKPPVIEGAIDFDEANGGDQHLVDITRPDGKRITVDKNYNVKIHKAAYGEHTVNIPDGESEEEVEEDEEAGKNKKKALTTTSGAAVIPEHVDGETKEMLNGGPQKTSMNKSNDDEDDTNFISDEDALCRIMKSNSVITFSQANKILETLKTLQMSKTEKTTQISDDLLEKSLAKLGFKKEDPLVKGKKRVGGEEEEDEDEHEEDEDEDGKEPAGKNKKPGLKPKTPLKKGASIKKKYDNEDEDDDEEDREEEDRDEEGNEDEEVDEPTKKKKGMKKSLRTTRLRKSHDAPDYDEMMEAITTNNESVGELKDMVKSLAVIAKHSYDLVKSQQDTIDEMQEKLDSFGDAPATARKSVVRKSVDRNFEKGMSGDDTLEKAEDGSVIVDVDVCKPQVLNMFDHMTFNKGAYNDNFAKGMSLFEASGVIRPDLQKSIETEFKVKLVRRGR